MRNYFYSFFIFILFPFALLAANNDSFINIIPKPVSVKLNNGFFELRSSTKIIAATKSDQEAAAMLNSFIHQNFGFKLKIITASSNKKNTIWFNSAASIKSYAGEYDLLVNEKSIEILGSEEGIFYGLQSLLQLFPSTKTLQIPCCIINDYPRFQWRGMHLDVSRHFFPKEFMKKYIDYLARYKMNVFHWHLTDDQGWRIEIKKYPLLTQVGAWRKGTMIGSYRDQKFDSIPYGGFYTQDDVHEIVSYAKTRHITIVPEIEMPGHCMAALAAYPQFSCTGGPFEVAKGWGGYNDVFIPTEETFEFLKNILNEVCELFPGKYIHIGGDEVDKKPWKENAFCQHLIKDLALQNEEGLQSYFIGRIDSFLTLKGKKLIGWDEILQGGLSPNATVMSWQGITGGVAAAKQNHHVVMCPGNPCYFDHYQSTNVGEPLAFGGYNPLENVYAYNPVPAELDSIQAKYILGAQANLWTEYIPTTSQVEYMIFPRLCALSEVCWTPLNKKSFSDFVMRLQHHLVYFDSHNINYSKALYDVKLSTVPSADYKIILISLSTLLKNEEIKFTLEKWKVHGPHDFYSGVFTDTISLNQNATLQANAFVNGNQVGRTLTENFQFNKATAKNVVLDPLPSVKYGNGNAFILVNAQTGKLPWRGNDWLGWSGKDMNATIDLQDTLDISSVTVDVLDAKSSWIHLPKAMSVSVSLDGINFTPVRNVDSAFIENANRAVKIVFNNTNARYVKVTANNLGIIPEGNPGAGKAPWLFVDEIVIE